MRLTSKGRGPGQTLPTGPLAAQLVLYPFWEAGQGLVIGLALV